MNTSRIVYIILFAFIIFFPGISAGAPKWYIVETEEFRFIYQKEYRHLVPQIIVKAETALYTLKKIFSYTPYEKINILIQNTKDTGGGGATSLPHNLIQIEVSPFTLDYEFTRFDSHFQWLLSHELTHIVMNDHAPAAEKGLRKLFGKVQPSKHDPLTIPFGLLTNYSRFTPIWHQEGIATFMETWLNGGYGRVFGNFDEMFFRTMVYENIPFMPVKKIDFADNDSFLISTTSYFYGLRFMSWLTIHYDLDKLFKWMNITPETQKYNIHFRKKFAQIFGKSIDKAWDDFFEDEKKFQKKNLEKIGKYPVSPVKKLCPPMGWVTKGYLDAAKQYFIFGTHKPHELSSVKKLDIKTGEITELHTLPSADIRQVASTAFDKENGSFFYTTHNAKGYRDVWTVNVDTGESRLLFPISGMGELAVNPKDHSLWGVNIINGMSIISVSHFPYKKITHLLPLKTETILAHLAISPDGNKIAATLHKANGEQEIILIDLNALLKKQLLYVSVSNAGNPEHPEWSEDGKYLYWDAYTSGVANIFRMDMNTLKAEALTNVNTGIFHPSFLDSDRIIAFYFTSSGFMPCIIKQSTSASLAAIDHLGQKVLKKSPEVKNWRLFPEKQRFETVSKNFADKEKLYQGMKYLRLDTLIPTVNAIRNECVVGLYTEFTDHLLNHRIINKIGFGASEEKFHIESSYEYRDIFYVEYGHSPASFYDLVNERKVNVYGDSILCEYKKWWIYDKPSTLEEWFYIEFNKGIEENNENGIVNLGTGFSGKRLRKTIGSIDYEHGYEWSLDARYCIAENNPDIKASLVVTDISLLKTYIKPHNVGRIQLAGGISGGDELSEGRFYFGGFGNRYIDNEPQFKYREIESLAGLSYRKYIAKNFIKFGLENLFPPLDIGIAIGDQYLSKMSLSVFSQFLYAQNEKESENYMNTGMQINFHMNNFYVLESTLSLGYAHAWDESDNEFDEFFISLKLFP
jgi:hypothetical protein